MKNKTRLGICVFCFIAIFGEALAIPKVIAHRGYWKTEHSAQNSLAALEKAGAIGCYGAEFDVQLTGDGKLVVVHDPVVEGWKIEENTYKTLKQIQLKNGENIPTLKEYLKAGKKIGRTRLILEIKSHTTPEKESEAVKKTLEMVKAAGLEHKTEYISFSKHILKEITRLSPAACTAYLGSDLSPRQIKGMGCSGVDYNYEVIRQNPSWLEEARQLGMTVNVWTVNDTGIMEEMISKNVDFITTDEPEKLQLLLQEGGN